MNIYRESELTTELLNRLKNRGSNPEPSQAILDGIEALYHRVKSGHDEELFKITNEIDGIDISKPGVMVQESEFLKSDNFLSDDLKTAIRAAIDFQKRYNMAIKEPDFQTFSLDDGVIAGRKIDPLRSVALYVPCGKGSYPSTFITIAVPAVVAGVSDIQVIIPPKEDGSIDQAVLFAAKELGIKRIFRVNGVAGIFAAATGTDTINKVQKVVGPGGPAIMAAQMLIRGRGVDAAMYFGPSECMIIADESATPELLAADLINEAEHGRDSSAILITTSVDLATSVSKFVKSQLEELPGYRKAFARSAMDNYGGIIIVNNIKKAINLANEMGNEHIQVATRDAWDIARQLNSASEILIGQMTTFSAISYAIGVPACLPTGQATSMYSPVTVDTFVRKSAIAAIDSRGLQNISTTITTLAEYEGFPAHAKSIKIRREMGII